MQRDSKQRSNKTASTRMAETVSATPSIGTETKPESRKRRRSSIELKGAPAAVEVPNGKPATAAKPAAKPHAATTRPRVSALDAAAQVLGGISSAEAKLGITAQDLIEQMAKQKLWTSPGGKTPQATLYAAMVREITAKGPSARFRKVSRGHFAAAASGTSAPKSSARQAAPGARKRAQP
ncbi:MAG: HTH domain-containing protein [Phycisphaerales bacterium]